jgi:hypothetical protein
MRAQASAWHRRAGCERTAANKPAEDWKESVWWCAGANALGNMGHLLWPLVKCRPYSSCAICSADIVQWCAPFLRQHAGRRDSGVAANAENTATSGRAKVASSRMDKSFRKGSYALGEQTAVRGDFAAAAKLRGELLLIKRTTFSLLYMELGLAKSQRLDEGRSKRKSVAKDELQMRRMSYSGPVGWDLEQSVDRTQWLVISSQRVLGGGGPRCQCERSCKTSSWD